MKRLLLLTLLCSAANSFCLNQDDQEVETPLAHVLNSLEKRRQQKYDERVQSLLRALVQNRSKEDLLVLANAYHDLSQACANNNECKVTDPKSAEALRAFRLVDDEGITTNQACKTVAGLKNNSYRVSIIH